MTTTEPRSREPRTKFFVNSGGNCRERSFAAGCIRGRGRALQAEFAGHTLTGRCILDQRSLGVEHGAARVPVRKYLAEFRETQPEHALHMRVSHNRSAAHRLA